MPARAVAWIQRTDLSPPSHSVPNNSLRLWRNDHGRAPTSHLRHRDETSSPLAGSEGARGWGRRFSANGREPLPGFRSDCQPQSHGPIWTEESGKVDAQALRRKRSATNASVSVPAITMAASEISIGNRLANRSWP